MKSLFSNLKKGNQIYIFVLLGIIFLLFPGKIAEFAPYIAGGTLIVYFVVNIIMEIRFPESRISLGDAVVRGVLGIILLLETEQAIAILGIVWAVLSLNDVAKEINDFYRTKNFRIIGAISIIITIILSALLMLDPFEHFAFHVRILGIEMITETFIRRREDE